MMTYSTETESSALVQLPAGEVAATAALARALLFVCVRSSARHWNVDI